MRLFSVKEINQHKNSDGKLQEIRALDELIKEKYVVWDELKQQLDPEKERLQKEFLSFNNNLQIKKSELIKQVSDLEDRREEALKPLNKKWAELELREAELSDYELQINVREINVGKDMELLMEKVSFVADKTNELDEREQRIKRQEDIAFSQQQSINAQLKELNQKWADLHLKTKLKEKEHKVVNEVLLLKSSLNKLQKELAIRQTELDDQEGMVALQQLNLDYKIERLELGEKTIEERSVWIANKVKSLRDREKQLINRQIELKRHDTIRSRLRPLS